MALANLSKKDREVVRACLDCVAAGKVILHDWEFHTLFGLEVAEFLQIVDKWPNLDDSDENVSQAIHCSMGNLLGYPHGKHDRWDEWMAFSKAEVEETFDRWRDN